MLPSLPSVLRSFIRAQACIAGEEQFRAAGWPELSGSSSNLSGPPTQNWKVRRSPQRKQTAGPESMRLESFTGCGEYLTGEPEPSIWCGNECAPREGPKTKEADEAGDEKLVRRVPERGEQVLASNNGQVGA